MTTATHAVSVLLDRELLALNRAVGALRRRNLPIESIALGPAEAPGLARLTIIFSSDASTVDTTVKKLHKLSGVRAAVTFPVDEGSARELALVKIRAEHGHDAALFDVLGLFKAELVEEGSGTVIVQVAGNASFVVAFLRAVEGFGILDVARSGSVALARATE